MVSTGGAGRAERAACATAIYGVWRDHAEGALHFVCPARDCCRLQRGTGGMDWWRCERTEGGVSADGKWQMEKWGRAWGERWAGDYTIV